MTEAAIAATCPKCQKPYERTGKFFERHVAACDGKVQWAPGQRPAASTPKVKDEARPSHIDLVLQEAVTRKEAVGREIALLEAQLQRRKVEQGQLDGVIETIKKAKEEC